MENRIHGEIGCRHNLENDLVVMMTTSVIIHESKLQISHAHKCIGNIKNKKKVLHEESFHFLQIIECMFLGNVCQRQLSAEPYCHSDTKIYHPTVFSFYYYVQ